MFDKLRNNIFYPLITTIIGTVIFFGAGLIFPIFHEPLFILGVPPLLVIGFLLLLGDLKVKNLPRFLFFGFLYCLIFGFIWFSVSLMGLDIVLAMAGAYIREVSRILFMLILLTSGGTFLGFFLHGRSSWKFFTPIYAILGLLFGFLNASMPLYSDIIIHIGVTAIGTSIGLASGLYEWREHPRRVVIAMIAVVVIGAGGIYMLSSSSPSDDGTTSQITDAELIIVFEDPVFEDVIRSYYKLGSGDIQWQDLASRKVLDLRYQRIDGEITSMADLKWFVSLEDLRWNSNQGGDLSAFEEFGDLENLTHLNLDDNKITGDIKYLQYLPNLEMLSLDDTNVYGDIISLANIAELSHFSLENTQVSGNISELTKISGLSDCTLDNTAVSGDIGSIEETNISVLSLVNTQVSGDICEMVAGVPNLEVCNLEGTDIHGDISCLAALEQLNNLNLKGTAVTGDLDSLEQLEDLMDLNIEDTAITGELNRFE